MYASTVRKVVFEEEHLGIESCPLDVDGNGPATNPDNQCLCNSKDDVCDLLNAVEENKTNVSVSMCFFKRAVVGFIFLFREV